MKKVIVTLSIAAMCSLQAQAQQAADATGQWLTARKNGIIEVYLKDKKLYGKVVWLQEPNNKQGQPLRDANNPDPSLRSRPIMGLNMLQGFRYKGEEWVDGTIYDPEAGKTYSCIISQPSKDELHVRGYVGMPWMGRTEIWTRHKQ